MKSSSSSVAANQQETYIRARDNTFFWGMRRGEAKVRNKGSIFDIHGKTGNKTISRSASDIHDRQSREGEKESLENFSYSPSKDSPFDIVLEPFGRSSSGRWSKTSSPLAGLRLDLAVDLDSGKELTEVSSPKALEANEECLALTGPLKPAIERSFSLNRGETILSKVPLPPSAALFYRGHSPQLEVVELSESMYRLNMYLKNIRDDLNAGVPGRFLHAVIGPDTCDVGSVVSTIMYAFYLSEMQKDDQFCTVPVINMKREDMNSRAELKWLLDSCHIDQSSLIFIDEIDLSYYDLFGSLKLVLLNCDKLPPKQEALRDSLIEIFHCRKHDSSYSWIDNITVGEDVSSCTVIAEKFAFTSPEKLVGQGVSRLLLAGILLDTGNLTNPQCTDKDKYISTLLINGAGRFGCNGLYQIMRYKMYDVTDLKVGDILRKEFKSWTKLDRSDGTQSRLIKSNIGMSSIGISVVELLSHVATSAKEITQFRRLEKLSLLLIVSGYYDTQKEFKREILVCAESAEVMKEILQFLNSHAAQLPVEDLDQPGLPDEMRAFKVGKVTSRSTIERLLEEYSQIS